MGKIEFFFKLFKRYDCSLAEKRCFIGWKGFIGKILWRFIRARQKVLL
jgi:hypothetical protein